MKKATTILLFVCTCYLQAFAQKIPKEIFDEGIAYVDKEDYKSAAMSFKTIVDNYPNDTLYPLALYNVAYVYLLDNDYNNAITAFEKVIGSDLNEADKIGGGIMDSPYANYKYKACQGLCEIYTEKGDYNKALEYLILSDKKYPFLHFCSNEGCSNETGMALHYASLYGKIGKQDEATIKLLELALLGNKKILEELKPLLAEHKEAKQKLEKAIEKIYSKKTDDGKEFYMKFLNAEMYVGYQDKENKFDKKQTIKLIKETEFYKMVQNF